MKTFASLALLAALTPACTMSRPARVATVASGAALAVGGVALASHTGGSDPYGNAENKWDDNMTEGLGGTALVGLGVILLVAGTLAHESPREATTVTPIATAPTPPLVTWSAPSLAAPSRATLPDVDTDDVVVRMAQQARSAVERGNCTAAWSTWDVMNVRDARYAAALAASPVFAPCPRATAGTF